MPNKRGVFHPIFRHREVICQARKGVFQSLSDTEKSDTKTKGSQGLLANFKVSKHRKRSFSRKIDGSLLGRKKRKGNEYMVTVWPLVRHRIKSSVQLTHGDSLGVNNSILDLKSKHESLKEMNAFQIISLASESTVKTSYFFLTCESVNSILKCDHLNETFQVLSTFT